MSDDSHPSLSASLFQAARGHDAAAWRRLVRLFSPLVQTWCRRAGLQDEDAADVSQEVFAALTNGLERFRHGEGVSFRAWLYGVTRRQMLAFWRKRKRQPVAEGGSEARQRFEEEADDESAMDDGQRPEDDRGLVLRSAVMMLREEVEEPTWRAFYATAVDGRPSADVAAELGLTVNSVYLAKSRLLKRLREELGELLD